MDIKETYNLIREANDKNGWIHRTVEEKINIIAKSIEPNDEVKRAVVINKLFEINDEHKLIKSSFMDSMLMIGTEMAEAIEAYRVNDRENLIEEIVDIMIRTLDLASGSKYTAEEFENALFAKMEKNSKRGYRHGNKEV